MNTPVPLVLDTCVLMHTFTRNLLLRLGENGICIPLWSEEIHAEWLRNAPRIWKVEDSVVENEWQMMQTRFPHSLIAVDMEKYPLRFKRIDKKDRHVALCAFVGQQSLGSYTSTLLTWNIKDFHKKELRDQGITLATPDQYLTELWPTKSELLKELFVLGQQDYITLEMPTYSIEEILKRDKLYRLAKIYSATLVS
ncbi:PIN domain-containing protein [Pelistega europaea]|uniref:PIN domain-containing protein n=1 Tax=Pelistega europaea TaxID=106147 RepID=A0A7Y4LBY3_9BURK|nr:PIN domain-containing protein [Pelistega europaea]NOL49481.1 PIN domain-containing protein [Pelistega europaea]